MRFNKGPLVVALAVLVWLGCQRGDADIRGAVQLLADEQGEVAMRAIDRLLPQGARALPFIETALHTAPPPGRRNLVVALRRLGLPQSAPLLGHLAAYDDDRGVRLEARWTLRTWQAQGGPRGQAASAALRKADDVRGTEDEG